MRIFNSEMIIGADGVVSAIPRGAYADKWAVRAADLADAETARALRDKVAKWFASQTEEDKNRQADIALSDLKTNVTAIYDNMAMSQMRQYVLVQARRNLVTRGMPPHASHFAVHEMPNDKAGVTAALKERYNITADPLWAAAENGIRADPDRQRALETHVRQEVIHALGGDALSPEAQATLAPHISAIAAAPADSKAYEGLKPMIRANIEALQADPVKRVMEAATAYQRNTGLDAGQIASRANEIDAILNNELDPAKKRFDPKFLQALDRMEAVLVTMPTPTLNPRKMPAFDLRGNVAPLPDNYKIGGVASNCLPIMGLALLEGEKSPARYFHDRIHEEGSHAIEMHGHYTPEERRHFVALHAKAMNWVAKIASQGVVQQQQVNGDQLALFYEGQPAGAQSEATAKGHAYFECAATLCEQQAGEHGPAAARLIRSLHHNMTDYSRMAQRIRENMAELLTLKFSPETSEATKKYLFDSMGLTPDIDAIAQCVVRPSTLNPTYRPNSIERNTMKTLAAIETIGPDHCKFAQPQQVRQ